MKIINHLIPNNIKNKIKSKMFEIVKNDIKSSNVDYKILLKDSKIFENKVAIVTGGSGAIGSAISFRLAMEGAHVIIAGRNTKKSQEVANYINSHNGKANICQLDITNYDDIKSKFKQIFNDYGRIDILINNAGGSARERANTIEKQSVDVIDELLDVNLRGTMLCSKEVIQYMKKNKTGRIINIGSTCGVNGLSGYAEYSTSKSGVIGFTKSLAMELARDNITVNCVSPGQTDHIIWDKGIEASNTNKNYIGKKGKTDDIANAVEFFCGDESSFIIGQNLIVDGGRSLGLKGE